MIYSIRNLKKSYARQQGYELLIRCLDLPQGALVAVTGPSGCGKSTMLDILGLALKPDEAQTFLFAPDAATNLPVMPLWEAGRLDQMASLRLSYMGYILQTGGLLPFITVWENILLTSRMAGIPQAVAEESAHLLVEQLGIAHLAKALPSTLSVGERQRVAIVRALTPKPRLILADEPTAALDPVHAGHVMDAFLSAVREQGGTLVMVTHNMDFARNVGLSELPFRIENTGSGMCAVLDTGDAACGA